MMPRGVKELYVHSCSVKRLFSVAPSGNRTQGKCLEGIYVTTTPKVLCICCWNTSIVRAQHNHNHNHNHSSTHLKAKQSLFTFIAFHPNIISLLHHFNQQITFCTLYKLHHKPILTKTSTLYSVTQF